MTIGIKTFLATILIVACAIFNPSFADVSLLPNAVQQFFSNDGKPLTKGTVTTYTAGTSTLKQTWRDSTGTTLNSNPITLDGGGKAIIYGTGTYRQVVKDKLGNLIWDGVTAPGGGGGSTPTLVGDGNAVGTIITWAGLTAPNQYVFAYGQELVRVTYPELYSAITLSTSATCTSASNTLSSISDTSQINVGQAVEATCLPAGTIVVSKSASAVVVSNPATLNISITATFFNFGNGNGSTTFRVPDLRGYVLAGRDNMGGVVAGRLTQQYFAANPDAQGAIGGVQTVTITPSNLPPYTPAGTVGTTLSLAATVQGTFTSSYAAGGTVGLQNSGTSGVTFGTATAASTFTGTAQGGISFPISNVQPTMTINYVIKVTPDSPASGYTGVASLGGMQGVIACGTGVSCVGNTISATSTPTALAQNQIFVGNDSGIATSVAMSGSCSIITSGTITCTTGGGVNVANLVCDNATDDRAALQSAIDATPFGGTLVIPAKTASGSGFTFCVVGRNPTVTPTLANGWYSLYVNKPMTIQCDQGVAIKPNSANTNNTTGSYPGNYGTIVGGTGYVDGTYTNVPLTGGGGSGAKATIIVSNVAGVHKVTSVVITDVGAGGYAVANVLSASNANLGGSGSGFTYTLTSLIGGTDIVYFKGSAFGLNIPTVFKGCFVGDPSIATRYGRSALVFDTLSNGTYFRAPVVQNVYLQTGTSGGFGWGIAAYNDATLSLQFNGGFYGAQLGKGSIIQGGIFLSASGDSNLIEDAIVSQCTVLSCGASADNNGILISPINTAGTTTLRNVNFTQSKGVKVTSGINFVIDGGEYELTDTLTGTALIDLDGSGGTMYSYKIKNAQFQANATTSTGAGMGTPTLLKIGSSSIPAGNLSVAILEGNYIATPTAYTPIVNYSPTLVCGPNFWSVGPTKITNGGTGAVSNYGGIAC